MMQERMSAFIFRAVAAFFGSGKGYELPEGVALSPDTKVRAHSERALLADSKGPALQLREELWLDDLALQDLAKFVNDELHANVTVDQIDKCVTYGDVLRCVVVDNTSSAARALAIKPDKMAITTVWMQEFRGALQSSDSAGGLLDPGTGYSKEDKLFARLRRTWRELKRPFQYYWSKLPLEQQRAALFQAAPLPLDGRDPEFPVSLLLMPEVHVDALLGEGFGDAVERRVSADFADVSRADMDLARHLQPLFSCPPEWDGVVMLLDGRKEVKIRSHKDEARVRDQLMSGQAVHGRLWIVYLARASSVMAMMQSVLDDFKRRQASLLKAQHDEMLANKHSSFCDACGQSASKLSRCGQCKDRYYCSRKCQTDDWPTHKKSCNAGSKPSFALKFAENDD